MHLDLHSCRELLDTGATQYVEGASCCEVLVGVQGCLGGSFARVGEERGGGGVGGGVDADGEG